MMIDALGQPCPIPVVRAKQALAALPAGGGVVEVLVDNTIACENLAKMANGLGHACAVRPAAGGNHLVVITAGAGQAAAVTPPAADASATAMTASLPPGGGLVAVIGSDCMGRGSEELGRILVKGFIYSLSQLTPVPQALLFFNSGVKLVVEGANTVPDVRALAEKGSRVLVCGTCVNYYQCADTLAVGTVVTMYDIVEAMNAGRNVISV